MAYDGTLKFDTSIDSKGFQSGIDGIGSIAEKGLKATGAILAGTATAIGAIGAASVKVGSDFEASMSKVAAISGATGDDLKALTDKAKEMGATTKFSASESADALQYMAMAGWKTDDMLNGLEGIMNLAAASGEDLATTSDIVTDALTAFGLSAEDSTHFADVLAQASSNANTNVGMMGETFKYVAPVAGALGYTAEDTALAIGLMANSGIKASQAGTSLRSIMSRMAKPTKEVQGAMDKLKVSLTDSNGNMKSLNEVMGDLRKGFAGLSEAEAAEMAAALGEQEAMSGLLAIVNASDDDFDKLSDAIYSCDGAAKRMADTMNDNLQGQITILKSGLEGLGISLYENMEAPLKEVVKEAQNMVQQLQDAFDNGGLDEVVTTVGDIFAQIVEKAASAAPDLIDVASDMIQSFLTGINNNLPKIASAGVDIVTSLGSALIENTGLFILSVSTLVAADFSPAYEFLYTLSPSAAQKLKPVSMISEDNGIKIEVISAYVESGEAKILISVQDLEEDRIDETTDLFDSFSINTSFDCSSSCENIKYDAETETAVFLISISQWDKYDIADEKITFSVREILSNKETYEGSISTLNLDKNSGSVKIFTPYSVLGGSGANSEKYMEDFQALVSQGDINSPVSGVALTAIGYVGEKLHIQIRYDSALETDNHGYVYLKNSDGDVLDCEASISFFTDEGEKDMYSEYIFDLSDKNVSDYVIYGKFTTSNMHIKGKWSVTFPLEKVR